MQQIRAGMYALQLDGGICRVDKLSRNGELGLPSKKAWGSMPNASSGCIKGSIKNQNDAEHASELLDQLPQMGNTGKLPDLATLRTIARWCNVTMDAISRAIPAKTKCIAPSDLKRSHSLRRCGGALSSRNTVQWTAKRIALNRRRHPPSGTSLDLVYGFTTAFHSKR